MDNVLNTARDLISQWYQQGLKDMKDPNKNYEMARNLIMGGLTTAPEEGLTKLLTTVPRGNTVSAMIPHVVDIYDEAGNLLKTTKPYSSLRKAIDVAKNYLSIPEGGRAFPRRIAQ